MATSEALKPEQRWAQARQAFGILDSLRPNPRQILSETLQLEHNLREPSNEFYSATTKDGQEYCYVDWAGDGSQLLSYYYGYESGFSLASQSELQEELRKRGIIDRLNVLERTHDSISPEEFLDFMTENDVFVSGPCPPTVESNVKGKGIALWMPKELFQKTAYYKEQAA